MWSDGRYLFILQSLSELTGNQIAARADEYEAGKEDGDGDDSADASEDGIITCKASVFLEFTL